METIPNKYLISKGTSFEVQNEGDPVPVVQLECYEYLIKKGVGEWYSAECKELHAYAQGKTWKELKSNILQTHEEMLEYV